MYKRGTSNESRLQIKDHLRGSATTCVEDEDGLVPIRGCNHSLLYLFRRLLLGCVHFVKCTGRDGGSLDGWSVRALRALGATRRAMVYCGILHGCAKIGLLDTDHSK